MSKIKKAIGWMGSIAFMFSGAPAALEALQNQVCPVPTGTLILWTVGEIGLLIYMLPKVDKVLLANYSVNLLFLAPMWYYFLLS